MTTRSLAVFLIVLGACGNVGSGSGSISTSADAREVVKVCDDEFNPDCWMGPWGEFEPPFEYPDAGVADAGADAGTVLADARVDGDAPDGGCVAQPEPACPQPPAGGYSPQNPGIVGGGMCRGACGPACPATCVAGPAATSCVSWQTADCVNHKKVCTYAVLQCGSHAGCRTHDNCYDACATLKWAAQRVACRRACDAQCVTNHGATNCNKWRQGNPPYDSWLSFTAAPTTATSEGTCN